MLHNYTIINDVDNKTLDLFEFYWGKYSSVLPALPSILHKGMDQKAAILNIWLFYSDIPTYKTLKSDRTFSHSFVYQLHQKNMSYLPSTSPLFLYPKAYEYQFLYAYYFGIEILAFLEEIFIENCALKKLLKSNYYCSTDADIHPNNNVFKLIKQFNMKVFNPTLSCSIYKKMHVKVDVILNKHYDVNTLLNKENPLAVV